MPLPEMSKPLEAGMLSLCPLPLPPTAVANLRMKPEQLLAHRVALFLKRNFPEVLYRFDLAADLPAMHKGFAARLKAVYGHGKGYPDLFIAHPIYVQGRMIAGLYLELKANRSGAYTKLGALKAGEHLREQEATLARLRKAGYAAHFAWGDDDQVFSLIYDYLLADAGIRARIENDTL